MHKYITGNVQINIIIRLHALPSLSSTNIHRHVHFKEFPQSQNKVCEEDYEKYSFIFSLSLKLVLVLLF